MTHKVFSVIKIFLLVIIPLAFNPHVFADNEYMGGYSIEGVPSDKQLDKNVSYFYLKENPKEKDKIYIKLINSSNKEKKLNIKIVDANTNDNGIIDYTGTLTNNKILKNPLTDVVHSENNVVSVPAKSSVETPLIIKMPEQRFNGVIMGGILVSEENHVPKNNTGNIGNIYNYTIGLIVTNENKIELFKNVSVELQSVSAKLSIGKKVVQANILNSNPYIFSKAEVKGAVYNEDGKTKIKEHSLNNVSIAPYSALPFQIDWQKDDLKPGTYIFKGTVKTEENTWSFEKKFEIKNTEAKKINKESVFKVVLPIWFIYSGYLVIFINIIGSFYIFIRKLKKQGEA